MKNAFSRYHPAVLLLYFALTLTASACLLHPLCLLISLASGLCYALLLSPKKLLRALPFLLGTALFAALLNPLFSHQGATILAYLPSGNPLTRESLLYGLAAGGMLLALFSRCLCLSLVVTSDKLLYLFGRALPSLALLLSMALRFVPKLTRRLSLVCDGQRALGREGTSAGERLKNGGRSLSILITWSLENAAETAASMRARGYGLPGRSAFSLYLFTPRDRCALVVFTLLGSLLFGGVLSGALAFRYFPTLAGGGAGSGQLILLFAYLALSFAPILIEGWEARQWKKSRSSI